MPPRELEVVDAEYVVVESAPPARTLDIGRPPAGDWSWRTALWIGALVALLGWVAWSDVLDLGLAGWDTFPLIAASRVESFADLLRVLGAKLMDGRFPGGDYWRPLVHASFALDHALGGLDPRAYHRTDFATTLAGGVATSWLALALLGRERRLWAAIAGFLFVLHPVFFELTPLPPRRADNLSLTFTLFALVCAARARTRTSYAAAGFAFLAACAKETGVLCALLVPALAAAFEGETSLARRARYGLRAAWPTLVAIAAFVALRTAVLGGLGGGAKASVAGAASQVGRVVARYAQLVVAPSPPSGWASDGVALAFGSAAVVVLAWRLVRARDSFEGAIEARALAAWLAIWAASLALLTAAAGVYRAWYAAPFAAPLALLAAAACAHRAPSTRGPVVRLDVVQRRVAALAALFVLAALQGWSSAGAQRWSEIRASSDAARDLCRRFDELVARAAPGSVVELDATPPAESSARHGVATKRPMTLREYSLQAYADLAHSATKLRVVAKRAEPPTAAADEIVVVLLGRDAEAAE